MPVLPINPLQGLIRLLPCPIQVPIAPLLTTKSAQSLNPLGFTVSTTVQKETSSIDPLVPADPLLEMVQVAYPLLNSTKG